MVCWLWVLSENFKNWLMYIYMHFLAYILHFNKMSKKWPCKNETMLPHITKQHVWWTSVILILSLTPASYLSLSHCLPQCWIPIHSYFIHLSLVGNNYVSILKLHGLFLLKETLQKQREQRYQWATFIQIGILQTQCACRNKFFHGLQVWKN